MICEGVVTALLHYVNLGFYKAWPSRSTLYKTNVFNKINYLN